MKKIFKKAVILEQIQEAAKKIQILKVNWKIVFIMFKNYYIHELNG